ncbi:MAG: hypothetical protein K2K97_10085 [Muribaculaceae bacterium]|nr:hypothetical protein [Muribaculaceae bacterium]
MKHILTTSCITLMLLTVGAQSASSRGLKTGIVIEQPAHSKYEAVVNDANDKSFSTTDPQLEWSQFKGKKGSAVISDKGLVLECKNADYYVTSITELSFNTETDNFGFSANFIGPKLSNDTKVGIVFDYSDSRNYKAITISKEQYSYFVVKDGMSSTVKTGLVKYVGSAYSLFMKKEADKIIFYLNGIEFAKFSRIKIESPYLGVMLEGKGKTLIPSFTFEIEDQAEQEESTTDR